ncbi:MAG TPA: hypothetical protein VMA98_01200 [Candidatus Acidoferrales bacterium]|nr:hypothetical protein [Candidatus Acidoferrales bacterium]
MLPVRADFQELKARFAGSVGAVRVGRERLFATAVPAIDALLGGGIPYGCVAAFEGMGSRSLAAALLAQATHSGLGAIIDGGELYPPSLEAAGVRLDRLMIVPVRTPVEAARAADVLLRSRAARVVVMAAGALRAAIWLRLARLAQRTGAVLVVLAARAIAEVSAVATVALQCRALPVQGGSHGLWGIFTGFEVRTDVRRYRNGRAAHA